MSLCWSWWEIIFGVELVVYDVWFAEDNNTGFLSVGLDIFDRLCFVKTTNFLAHGANECYKHKIW